MNTSTITEADVKRAQVAAMAKASQLKYQAKRLKALAAGKVGQTRKASPAVSVFESSSAIKDGINVHRANLRYGRFKLADAQKIAERVAASDRSDPFIYSRTVSELMNGVSEPENYNWAKGRKNADPA